MTILLIQLLLQFRTLVEFMQLPSKVSSNFITQAEVVWQILPLSSCLNLSRINVAVVCASEEVGAAHTDFLLMWQFN